MAKERFPRTECWQGGDDREGKTREKARVPVSLGWIRRERRRGRQGRSERWEKRKWGSVKSRLSGRQ